jgi:quercetin dioxygenase-like cupin family protein
MEVRMKVKNYRDILDEPVVGEAGLTVRWLVSDLEEQPEFAMRLYELEPGHATASHVHHWEHQAFVLDGQGVVGGETGEYPLNEGDVVYVPPLERHQFSNTSDRVLRFLMAFPIPRRSPDVRAHEAGSASEAAEDR